MLEGLRWLGDANSPYAVGGRVVFPGAGDRPDASLSKLGLDLDHGLYVVQNDDKVAELSAILYPGLTSLSVPLPPPGGAVQLPPWSVAWLRQALAGGVLAGHPGAVPWRGSLGRTRWLGAALVGGVDRAAVVALASSYVGVSLGDPRFEEVTQGRASAKGYSACGDLWNFVLWRIGVRESSIVNRAEPSAGLVWHIQENLSRPVSGAKKVGAWVDASPTRAPKPGDLVLIGHYPDEVEHAFVHTGATGNVWTSADYGQVDPLTGKPSSKKVKRELAYPNLGSRRLIGWIDVDRLPRAAAADLPGTSSTGKDLTAAGLVLGAVALLKWLV